MYIYFFLGIHRSFFRNCVTNDIELLESLLLLLWWKWFLRCIVSINYSDLMSFPNNFVIHYDYLFQYYPKCGVPSGKARGNNSINHSKAAAESECLIPSIHRAFLTPPAEYRRSIDLSLFDGSKPALAACLPNILQVLYFHDFTLQHDYWRWQFQLRFALLAFCT